MGMYSGQAAAAGVEGYKSGYKFQQDAERAYQDSLLKTEQIETAKSKNKALRQIWNEVDGMSAEQSMLQKHQGQIDEMNNTIKTQNATTVKKSVNEGASQGNAKDRTAWLNSIVTRMKSSPETYKALGIKNPKSMTVLNPNDSKDVEWMKNTLSAQGISDEQLNDPAFIAKLMDGYPAIKADGAIVDLRGLSVVTGAAGEATPAYAKQQEKQMQELMATTGMNKEDAKDFIESKHEAEGTTPVKSATLDIGNDEVSTDIKATEETSEAGVTDIDRLKSKEGLRNDVYKDSEGYDTVGYGHKLTDAEKQSGKYANGVTDQQAEELLAKDMKGHREAFENAEPWVKDLPIGQQQALNDMAYNMGPAWMDNFPSVRKAIQAGDMEEAGRIIASSKYAKQVGNRAMENVDLLTGKQAPAITNTTKEYMGSEYATASDGSILPSRMRHLYALAGLSYPEAKDPRTVKMKNYDFLKQQGFDDAESYKAVFGNSKTGSSGRMQKAIEFRRTLTPGSQEYKDQTSYITKLGRTGTASEYDFNQWKKELADLNEKSNPTEKDFNRIDELKEKIRDSKDTASIQTKRDKVRTVKSVRDEVKVLKPKLDKFYMDGTKLSNEDSGNLQDLQDELYEFAPSKTKERDTKTIDSMKANQIAGIEIDDVLKRFKPGGDLEKMEKGVVDNAAQWVETKLPKGMVADNRKATIEDNIKAGSTLGYLQATLIKAMSGTAAAEAEVMRLQRVMQGDDWNQPEALKIALEEFYDHIERQQGTLGKQLRVSPFDKYQLSDMKSDREDPSAKTETRRGKTADGRTVIQYSDGSTEVQ